jgi:general stress protein 26
MSNDHELAEKFWKALKSDMTVMLGVTGAEEGHSRPMTAQLDDKRDDSPIYFFASRDSDWIDLIDANSRAVMHFVAKGHELFASVHGELSIDNDRTTIDRLWNPFVAAWYEGGKDDPKLLLLRLDPEQAQIWLNENSLFAGAKMLLGRDPKRDYRDKVAEVRLDRH